MVCELAGGKRSVGRGQDGHNHSDNGSYQLVQGLRDLNT